jgi:hypothetical protein
LFDQCPLVASQRLAKEDTTPRRNFGKEQIGSVWGIFCLKRLLFSPSAEIGFCKPVGLRPADAGQTKGITPRRDASRACASLPTAFWPFFAQNAN